MDTNNTTSFPTVLSSQKPVNCSNFTVEPHSILEDKVEAYAVPIVFALIFIIGITGNGSTIFIVLRNKAMRNVPNIFIVSLATGDLLLLLTSVPFTATIYTFKEWPYGKTMCKLNECLQTMSLGISVFTLTVLSWDRYNAISRPIQQARGNSLKRTILTAGGVWLISFCLSLVDAISASLFAHKDSPCGEESYYCVNPPFMWGEKYKQFHTIFRFLVYFALPMIFICFFYVSMAKTLYNSSKEMLNGGTSARKQIEARKKVARVVLTFVIVFIFCWFPRHIYLFWFVFDPGEFNMFWHVFKIVSFCFSFINSCMNPLALYFLSRQFRRYFHKYIFCCCPADGSMPKAVVASRVNGPGGGNKGGESSYGGYTCMVTANRPNAINLHQHHHRNGGKQNRCVGHGVYTSDTTRIISSSPSPSHKTCTSLIRSRSPSPSHKNNVYINMYRRDDVRPTNHRLKPDLL